MIVVFIILGMIATFVGSIFLYARNESRSDEEIADTSDWIETEATIQSAAIERLDRYTRYPSFSFSYTVNGEYFSGIFFLKSPLEKESEDLTRTLINHTFPVQYDPDSPSAWYVAEKTIAGYEIIQKLDANYPSDSDFDPYRNDGNEPIDLNLNK
jgi:hypothetical protein